MSQGPLLELSDVHVRIAGSHILQGVSCAVPGRGITALLGRNGVGKTTTLRAIMGLNPSSGSITFAGQQIRGVATHRIVRRGVGYVPEDRDVFAGLTVGENLRLAVRDADPDYELVYQLFPELRERDKQLAGTLSGGQQQMVALARALLNRNRLLLIDEPTKGLSPRLVDEVADALERVADAVPMLLVEQNLPVVRKLATDVVVMASGRVVHTGSADSLQDPELTRRLLGVALAGGPA
ncbi:ATP-binding cassette domain-containing protein [Flexivirga oryzae]|uniref:Branched-chain amino acid transport system ATP-binding protein n=1 Tax=Flexivirga oryzae TaxID=1794944 RepID=A0A839N4R7_9MICO|nr:branched-chain amino acid transport system ATP-binding protein [Flexivirga oryzae]